MEDVILRHKETKGVFVTTRQAFTNVWSKKGWEELEPSKLSKDELAEVADLLSIELPTEGTKDQLAAALSAAATTNDNDDDEPGA